MPLVDAIFLREDHALSDRQPEDAFLLKRVKEAGIELKKWIGTTNYAAALAALEPNATPTDEELEKAEAFQLAESALVMYFAIPRLNLKVSDQGLIQSANSKNFGDATFRVAAPTEIKQLQKIYWNSAWKLASAYISTGTGPLPVGSTTTDE